MISFRTCPGHVLYLVLLHESRNTRECPRTRTRPSLTPILPRAISSNTGATLTVLTILYGLMSFVLCLFAEATPSQRLGLQATGKGRVVNACIAGAGRCRSSAHLHLYQCQQATANGIRRMGTRFQDRIAVAGRVLLRHDMKSLLIGLSIESAHLKDWSSPKTGCPVIHQGLFCAAGVLALTTVLLSVGQYLTALSLQGEFQEQDLLGRRMLEASVLYASP